MRLRRIWRGEAVYDGGQAATGIRRRKTKGGRKRFAIFGTLSLETNLDSWEKIRIEARFVCLWHKGGFRSGK